MKILILLFFISCKETTHKKKLIFYTDSTFKHRADSVFVDSLLQIQHEGFVKIYDHNNEESFERGKLKKGIKVGKWQSYIDLLNEITLDEERIYSQDGHLKNYKSFDHLTRNILEDKNYFKDNIVGIQKEFYPTGNLHISYETDNEGNFINDFIVLAEDGKEIFTSDLGKDGTGIIKYYDKDNHLLWEGYSKINRKKVGITNI